MSPAEARLKEVKSAMSDAEWEQRVNLAACYRLVALYGWDDLVDTHISARVPGPEHHFLINPYGLMFDEITASSLVKVDLDGNQLSESDYSINPAGFTIHSAVSRSAGRRRLRDASPYCGRHRRRELHGRVAATETRPRS